MSSSSIWGSGSISKYFGSKITWQVEHASDPSHAPVQKQLDTNDVPMLDQLVLPSRSMSFSCANVSKSVPMGPSTDRSFPSFSTKTTLTLKNGIGLVNAPNISESITCPSGGMKTNLTLMETALFF